MSNEVDNKLIVLFYEKVEIRVRCDIYFSKSYPNDFEVLWISILSH